MKNRFLFKKELEYAVGAMLYTPATNVSIADSVINGIFCAPYSLAICLEDSISDSAVEMAEAQLFLTLKKISDAYENGKLSENIPLIFVRVRSPFQFEKLGKKLLEYSNILTGFVMPKFTSKCACEYIEIMLELNSISENEIFMMPILESGEFVDIRKRCESLYEIKEKLDKVKDMVLNIRVGGNDLCNNFAVRRHADETIYEIGTVSNILYDILSVFSNDYVVSGPVWEYFTGKDDLWRSGLIKETKLDILNGFIGKTVIHPAQIEVVNKCLAVRKSDYDDACSILKWSDETLGVSKNESGQRMNEVKTHCNWAEKIIRLANIYGVNCDESF